MALYHFSAKVLSRSSRNTVRALAYRAGCKLYDERTGETFNYESKLVQHVELVLPKDAPEWAREIQDLMKVNRQKGVQAFSDSVERAEKRIDAQVYREFEFALYRELSEEQNIALAREFVQDQICSRGMAAQLNFHFDVDKETEEEKPHCHVVATLRPLEEKGLSSKKERDWNKKEFLQELRIQWQDYSNFYLKLHGHDIQIDHRCHKERGIELEPQPKLGRGVLEQEKRIQKLEGGENYSPFTDKAKAFHEVQLRNLYRIIRNPETVFDIVTKHHATFMWGDVQKVLHRYVDEVPLFQRLENKLKNSRELLVLRPESENKAVYTTHSMLKAEKSLVKAAEELGESYTHRVDHIHVEHAITKANEGLGDKRGLSLDQIKAIRHLTEEGQLKCVVGIAGAGKTTALGVCQEIWKAEGYAVYGLAPTGKAAQNLESKTLEQSGINATTLHKFLKSFEEGRCQYNDKSVLVLDEAGMVDVERFGKLLGVTKKLGVKLIVVGDGAQLQPVEAGPAFRLVTERLGKAELNTVLRQKEEWQREATILFGQQRTNEAIQQYMNKGHVHIVEEELLTLHDALQKGGHEGLTRLYEVSHRMSSLMYREMANEVKKLNPTNPYSLIREHQDFEKYLSWKDIEQDTATFLLKLPKEPKTDFRKTTKEELIKAWHSEFKNNSEKSCLILAYSNKDVKDLNQLARSHLKESGHISMEEVTYKIRREIEDDFGKKQTLQEEKAFAKGDRIVFTRNNYGMGVKNGTMGTITDLDNQKVQVKLHEGKEISFAPNLNPYFDQGWAITIHKSQGTTVDKTYVLASYEMTQNLAYVAMTRHREDVRVFASSLDF